MTQGDTIPGGLHVHWAEVDGLRLRLALAPPLDGGRSLVLLNGRTEFLEKYEDVYGELRARGFRVATLDWRGQGGSDRLLADRRRGYARDFRAFQRDLDAFLQLAAAELAPPWFALAHSMGALILLERLAAAPDTFARAVLSAPFLGIRAGPVSRRLAPLLAATACRLGFATAYVPGHGDEPAAGEEPAGNVLTSDHDRFRLYRARCRANAERLVGGVTYGWLDAALRAIGRLERPGTLEAITTPMLLMAAGHERVVDIHAIERAAARLPRAELRCFDGAEHELMMERDPIRDRVLAAVDDCLR